MTQSSGYRNPDTIYDSEQSQLALTVYHARAWLSGKRSRNFTKHYLKFVEDASYEAATTEQQTQMELVHAVRVIESKVNGPYRDNPIRTILLYTNDNQGGLSDQPNVFLCKLIVKVGQRFETMLNREAVANHPEAIQTLEQLPAAWQFHIQRAYQ